MSPTWAYKKKGLVAGRKITQRTAAVAAKTLYGGSTAWHTHGHTNVTYPFTRAKVSLENATGTNQLARL